MYDIVYYFQGNNSEELKYSIRTVEKNINFKKIYLVGDKPEWFKITEKSIYVKSQNLNLQKYGLGSVPILHLKNFLNSGLMPESFLLFNDDFFIMNKIDKWIDYYRDEKDYNKKALKNHGYHKKTLRSLQYTETKRKYNLHIPILIEKKNFEQLLKMWESFSNKDIDFRTLYGNLFIKSDKKIFDLKIGNNFKYSEENIKLIRSSKFISTSDESFKNSLIGNMIKSSFKESSYLEML